jgi:gas vesicle structural protein
MAVERAPAGTSLIDVLDRVLDKGIVIDAYVRVTLVGIDLIGVEARIVVASVDTYLRYSDQIALTAASARPAIGSGAEMDRLREENRALRDQLASRTATIPQPPEAGAP